MVSGLEPAALAFEVGDFGEGFVDLIGVAAGGGFGAGGADAIGEDGIGGGDALAKGGVADVFPGHGEGAHNGRDADADEGQFDSEGDAGGGLGVGVSDLAKSTGRSGGGLRIVGGTDALEDGGGDGVAHDFELELGTAQALVLGELHDVGAVVRVVRVAGHDGPGRLGVSAVTEVDAVEGAHLQ